jgi:hypothetical protein
MARLLLRVVNVVLAAMAMTCLYVFLLLMVSGSPYSAGYTVIAGYAIGWILIPVLYTIAVFAVSFSSGMLFARGRWVVRPAATIPLLLSLYFLTLCVTDTMRSGFDYETLYAVLTLIVPMVIGGVIAFCFSPLFHDWGRVLRNRLKRNHNLGEE